METFFDSFWFNWIILPFLIFITRILDVSLGTLRILLISRGKTLYAPLIGFIEVLIWLIALRQIFNNLNNWFCYIAFAGGFAAGNYVGLWIDEKIAMGYQVVRIITRFDAKKLIQDLKDRGLGVTVVDAEGRSGVVKILFSVIQRKNLQQVRQLIEENNPQAFYSVEDVKMASEGIFPIKKSIEQDSILKRLKFDRKGK